MTKKTEAYNPTKWIEVLAPKWLEAYRKFEEEE